MVKVSDLWCWAGGDASLGAQLTVLLFVTAIHHTSRCHDVTKPPPPGHRIGNAHFSKD